MDNRESKRQRLLEECIFTSTKEEVYEPQIIETQASYEEMLSGSNNTAADAKKVIQKLVNPSPNQVSDQLVSPGSFVTDFHDAGGDTIGSAVTHGEDDESHLDIVQEHDVLDRDGDSGMQMGGGMDDDSHGADEGMPPNVLDVDAYWLHRKISQAYDQQIESQQSNTCAEESKELNGPLYDQQQLLESIAFHQDGLMTNNKCELPVHSYRKQNKGYEEVYLPALEPKPLAADEKLVLIEDMPSRAQHAFEGMTELNRVQSRVYETALFKADNILLSAPTGAGKTIVAMLTILQQMGLHISEDGSLNNTHYKIVYVAPFKYLVTKVVGFLSNRLKYYYIVSL